MQYFYIQALIKKEINKINKITVTVAKIDSSQWSGKNFITWAWLASTTIINDDPVQSVLYYSVRRSIMLCS
jgi:hypothetical protein